MQAKNITNQRHTYMVITLLTVGVFTENIYPTLDLVYDF